jgi:hypothetical protein
MILLKVDDAGHGGNSGQYSYLEDLAFEYAFLISCLGASHKVIPPGNMLSETLTEMDMLNIMNSPTLYRRTLNNPHVGALHQRLVGNGAFFDVDSDVEGHQGTRRRFKKDNEEEKVFRHKAKDRQMSKLLTWVRALF